MGRQNLSYPFPLKVVVFYLSLRTTIQGEKVFLLQKDTRIFPSLHVMFIVKKLLSLFHVQALLLVNHF